MQSIKTIFKNSIRDYDEFENLENFIKDITFELSHKKIYRLKDTAKINTRLVELFELFANALKEVNLYTNPYLKSVISGLIDASNYESKKRIYELYYEKERVEKEINTHIKNIQQTSSLTYESFSQVACKDEVLDTALTDAKLSETQMLGILKEVASEALITTLEQGKDIEETAQNITKNLVYQNLNDEKFAKKRVLSIIQTILNEAVELADANQANAEDLLKGVVFGSRDGMLKIVERCKNNLKYAPRDEEVSEEELQKIKDELHNVEDDFIKLLREYTKKIETISGKIITQLLCEEIDTTTAKILKASNDAKELINEKLEELSSDATYRLEQLKESAEELEKNALQKMDEFANSPTTQQVKEEAKKLGERAWEAAKDVVKNAKEAINKK